MPSSDPFSKTVPKDKESDLPTRLRLGTRYALTTGGIVLAFFLCLALLSYVYLRQKAIEETRAKALVVFAITDGIGAYVTETLRPRMFDLLNLLPAEGRFVAEAMSTTRIKHGIMDHLTGEHPEFTYRRVSVHPRNPQNRADDFHKGMFQFFSKSPQRISWQGIREIRGEKYYFILKPIFAREECLRCHGEPKDAPAGLIDQYGSEAGFGHKTGELMGIESISFSLHPAFSAINQATLNILAVGSILTAILFLAIEGSFLRLVSQPLRSLSRSFIAIAQGDKPLRRGVDISTPDEIGELAESFNLLASRLADAQDSLKYNAGLLQSVLNGITDPIALVNRDCSLSVINHAYQEWIGRGSPAVLGGPCHPAHEDGTLCPACLLEEVFVKGKALSQEWRGTDGRYYETRLYPVRDETGAVSQVVHSLRDTTTERDAEERMHNAEKLASIGQLSAGIAHEINNPLGVIHCYTRLLKRSLARDGNALSDLAVIEKHIQSCKQIVDGLLSFARREKTEKRETDLNALALEVLAMVKKQLEKTGISIETRLDPGLPRLILDEGKMKQVLLNLLLNAAQAMPEGGVVSIQTAWDSASSRVELKVEDSGIGIPEEHIHRIFDPFFTTKRPGEGTGLGLSVSFGIVKEHSGDIAVRSSPGKGSLFTVSLPVN